MERRVRAAFVVQRCGREVNGGAEAACLTAASHMGKHWEIDILTTCALDYMTWSDHYPPGDERIGNVTVRRFPVSHVRDVQAFNRKSEAIVGRLKSAPLEDQVAWMRAQGPFSDALTKYIAAHREIYDVFFFYTYLYATTYFGLPAVRDKALLVPFAHDEWPIHLSMWDEFFGYPRGLVFSAHEEREFLRERFPDTPMEGEIVGVGIDPPEVLDARRFREKYAIDGPFMLYVGRIDEAKNSPMLFDYFLRLKAKAASDLKLILIGRSQLPVPQHPDIHELGFVSDQDKWDALAACQFLVNPSALESLSIVMLEAWHAKKPVLVNASADVMVGHCRRSNGGLWFSSYEEFEAEVAMMGTSIGPRLGEAGHRYTATNYRWAKIEEQYMRLAERVARVDDLEKPQTIFT
jgi:glycosyltransferase involved in cell wall biosynthesis